MSWRECDPSTAASAAGCIDVDEDRALDVDDVAEPAAGPAATGPTAAGPAAGAAAPASSDEQQVAALLDDPEALLEMATSAVAILSGCAARMLGEQWRATEKEARTIAKPALDVVQQEMGTLRGDPWTRLYFALGLYALPRILPTLVAFAQPRTLAAAAGQTSSTSGASPEPTSIVEQTGSVN